MSRYYSFNILVKKKNKKKKKFKIVFRFLLATACLTILIFVVYKISKVKSLYEVFKYEVFKIQKVYLCENKSTVPDEIIYKQLNAEHLDVFNYKKNILKLQKVFPEIKEIKIMFFPTKPLKIKIHTFSPIGYKKGIDDGILFLSSDIKWYKVYDARKINLAKLPYIEGEVDIPTLKIIYQKFSEANVWDKVEKIRKENNKYVVCVRGEEDNCILYFIVDKKFENVKKEMLSKLIKYKFDKNTRIYTQLLSYGKAYIE